jgi:tetratricopeptide (TPR) repeat protein
VTQDTTDAEGSAESVDESTDSVESDDSAEPTGGAESVERTATEEREFLLRSLDDLDAEFEAGDLDRTDYETLRDGYVARAAEVQRAIDDHREAPLDIVSSPGRLRRNLLWVAGVVVIAAVSGWLLARSVGAKSTGETITGSAPDQLDSCQKLSLQKPAQGITCYDKILVSQPQNTDALTYKGWALVRMGKTAQGSALFDRVVALNKRYPDVYVFRASVKANAGDFPGAQAELDTLYALNPPAGLISTMQSQGLDREIAFGLLPAPAQKCWKTAEDGLESLASNPSSKTGTTKIADSIKCYVDLLATDPTNINALEGSGYLLGASASDAASAELLLPKAVQYLQQAVQQAPTDPTARVLLAELENEAGDPGAAKTDLDALKALGRPSALYPITPVDQIEQNVKDQLKAAASSTTTTTTP